MPSELVTRTHAAPIRLRYSCAWSSTSPRFLLRSRRSRNCGTPADTALMPASVWVLPARKSSTALRVLASWRPIAASAVRFAWIDVTPNVPPSTATTSSAEARKIFPASPKVLITLASGVGGVVAPELVLVRLPFVAAGVERDVDLDRRTGGHDDVLHHFGRRALVPHVQPVVPGRHVVEREAAVAARLGEPAIGRDHHERDHARMHVAEHAHQTGTREGVT